MNQRRVRPLLRAKRTILGVAVLAAAAVVAPVGTPAGRAGGTCRGEPVTILGSDGDDQLSGTNGPDVIGGLGGDDHIEGLGGNDVICGDGGTDSIDGGAGTDTCDGGTGTDSATGCERSTNIE
jgi:Ca2+-binding RTX toxin-like protein